MTQSERVSFLFCSYGGLPPTLAHYPWFSNATLAEMDMVPRWAWVVEECDIGAVCDAEHPDASCTPNNLSPGACQEVSNYQPWSLADCRYVDPKKVMDPNDPTVCKSVEEKTENKIVPIQKWN